jgi:hypothetical protein
MDTLVSRAMSWDAVIFDFEDTLVDITQGRSKAGGPVYFTGARGVPPVTDRAGRPFVEALAALSDAGVPVAVVTSSPEAAMRRWFQELGYALPIVVIGFHDTVLHRPSPHPLAEALSQLGLPASPRVLSVGDSADDITAAHRAGLTAGTLRDYAPSTCPPDVFLPFVESFFDEQRVFGLAGNLDWNGPSISLQLELPGHVCRVGGPVVTRPANRLAQMLDSVSEGAWPYQLVSLAKALIEHAIGDETEGVVLTWVPAHTERPDRLKSLMLRLKEETDLTVSPLLRYQRDPGPQNARDRSSRLSAMSETMEARGKVSLAGRTLLVLDDVRGTGATLAEAARALAEAGASRVIGLALGQEVHRADDPTASYGPLTIVSDPNAASTPTQSAPATRAHPAPVVPAPVAPRPLAQARPVPPTRPSQPPRTRPTPTPAQPAARSGMLSPVAPLAPAMPSKRPSAAVEAEPAAQTAKTRYPRAYTRWTPEEDALLGRMFKEGKDLPAMCAALGRQPKSVETRIRRVEIDIDESDFREADAEPQSPEKPKSQEKPLPAASRPPDELQSGAAGAS